MHNASVSGPQPVFMQEPPSHDLNSEPPLGKDGRDETPAFPLQDAALDALLQRVLVGDPDAKAEFWKHVWLLLNRIVHHSLHGIVRSREQTDDIAAEVFCVVYRHIDRFNDGAHLKNSLAQYVQRKLADLYHRHIRHRRDVRREEPLSTTNSDGDDAKAANGADGTSPPAAAERSEQVQELRMAMQHLRAHDRQLIVWRDFDHLSWAKIAIVLGISEDSARQRYRRATEDLRSFMRRRYGSESV